MWLYVVAGVIVLLGIAGAAFGGGIFTIVLVPIGLLILASAVGSAMVGRSSHGAAGAQTEGQPTTGEPLPHRFASDTGSTPTTPDRLVDERRVRQ